MLFLSVRNRFQSAFLLLQYLVFASVSGSQCLGLESCLHSAEMVPGLNIKKIKCFSYLSWILKENGSNARIKR